MIKGRVEASHHRPVSTVEVWARKTADDTSDAVHKSNASVDGSFVLMDLPLGRYDVSIVPLDSPERAKPLIKKTDVEINATTSNPHLTCPADRVLMF